MSTVPPAEEPGEGAREQSSTSGISDAQWEAFQREAAEGGGEVVPEEPSARARTVAQQLQEATGQRAGSRRRWPFTRDKRPAQPATPPGWRTGPAWQEMNGGRNRRRHLRTAFGVVLAVAVAVLAVRPSLLDRLPGRDAKAADSPSPLSAETALPSSAPDGGGDPGIPTPEHPFLGSPARQWAGGADAIDLPAAKAVGTMSKEDVALALRRTKEFLVGTNLEPAVLRGGRPTHALSLLDPQQPGVLADLKRSLRDPDKKHDPVGLVSRFDPSEVRPAGTVVKVRGHMTFKAGKPGEVLVHADYTFVYPLLRADKDGDERVARTIVRRDVTMGLADPHKWITTKGKLLINTYDVETYNNECGVHDGYLHPVFPGDAPTGAPATGPAADPYDRSQSMLNEKNTGCGEVTRT